MQKRDQGVLAALVVGLLIGAAATYTVLGSLSRTSTTTTTLPAVKSTTTVTSLMNVTSSGASTSFVSTGESSSTISPAPCALSYRVPPSNVTTLANGTQITENATPAFVMGAGSTMELCVEYTNSFPNPDSFSLTITALQWTSCFPTCESPAAKNFSTSASTATTLLSQGQSTVVEYTISAGENSTGFVGLYQGYYFLGCIRIPVAVGYLPSQVNASDFPGYGSGDTFCPPSQLEAQIIGYTGGSVAYLTDESRG